MDVCRKYAEALGRTERRIRNHSLQPDDSLLTDLALIEFIDSLRYSMDPALRECFEKTYLFPSGETGGYCLYDASQRRKACLAFYDSMISSLSQNT